MEQSLKSKSLPPSSQSLIDGIDDNGMTLFNFEDDDTRSFGFLSRSVEILGERDISDESVGHSLSTGVVAPNLPLLSSSMLLT